MLMETFIDLVEAIPIWGWGAVIVICILSVEGYVKLRRMNIKHAERMAKIKQGIDPGQKATTRTAILDWVRYSRLSCCFTFVEPARKR